MKQKKGKKYLNTDDAAIVAMGYTLYTLQDNSKEVITKEDFAQRYLDNKNAFVELQIEEVPVISDEKATELLAAGKVKAEKMLMDDDKINRMLERVEEKLMTVPAIGPILAEIVTMICLVKDYTQKRYTDLPVGSIISIIAALAYFASPVDLFPDSLPGIGFIDDAAVLRICLKLCESDISEYRKWKKSLQDKATAETAESGDN